MKSYSLENELFSIRKELRRDKEIFKKKEKWFKEDFFDFFSSYEKEFEVFEKEVDSIIEKNNELRSFAEKSAQELILKAKNISKVTNSSINKLIDEWKSLTENLSSKRRADLEKKFYSVISGHKNRLHSSTEERKWQELVNLQDKESIINKVKELSNIADLKEVFEKLKKLQKQWKEIGSVPYKKSDEIWKLFQVETQKQFERCKEFLDEKEERHKKIIAKKEKFCEDVERIKAQPISQKNINEIKDIQRQWKGLDQKSNEGKNNKLWHKFSNLCNEFFEGAQGFKKQSVEAKKNILHRLQSYKSSSNIDDDLFFVKKLQQEWKQYAYLSGDELDIEKNFRDICDKFFGEKKEFESKKKQQENEYVSQRKTWLDKVKAVLKENENSLIENWLADTLSDAWSKFKKERNFQKDLEEQYKHLLKNLGKANKKTKEDFFVNLNLFEADLGLSSFALPLIDDIAFFAEKLDSDKVLKELSNLSKQEIKNTEQDENSLDFLANQLKDSFGNEKSYFSYEEADTKFMSLVLSCYYISKINTSHFKELAANYLSHRQKIVNKDAL